MPGPLDEVADVYRAHDQKADCPVALKLLRMSIADVDEMRERFYREARALETLSHPGIVGLLDHGTMSDGVPFLVMELLLGRTLKQVLETDGGVSPARAFGIVRQILGGGSASRLYTRIREERGLAYNVYAQYAPFRLAGLLLVELQTENARVREALAVAREELIRLRRERVAEYELSRARSFLVASFPLQMSTAAEVSDLLVEIERHDLGLDYPARFRQAVSAVTADDVLRAVRAHWDPDGLSLALVGNLREAGIGSP